MKKVLMKKKTKSVSPAQEERRAKRTAALNRYALLLHGICSVLGYFLIEAMARHSIPAAWQFADERTKVFFYNAFLIFVTTLPAFLIRKRSFYRLLVTVFWFALGAANGIILANRVTPLTGPDFGMISEALSVSGKYFSKSVTIILLVLIVLGLIALVRYLFTSPSYGGPLRLRIWIPVFIGSCAALYGFTQWGLAARQLSSYFSNIASAYLDYGFPYSLSVTIFDTGITQPNGYSEKLVEGIVGEEGKITETEASDDKPNIVIVQLESFFDPTRVRGLKFSEDPLPNWHKLSKTYSNGCYTVPTVGAGTVNTEFETLTGMSLRFFGAGEYPYKGILRKETCESAAFDLAKLGYSSHAVHNNEANFYGRRKVYANLGFNSFTSGEYMDTQNDVNENGWMRDENLIRPIEDALDSTDHQDFVFTVSVQPHGAYPTEPTIADPKIRVSGAGSDEKNCAWEYYTNQIYEEDSFVADLIDALKERGEPTICLFYGDHLPTMGLSDRDLRGGTIFQTNYLIWSNLNGQKRSVKTITAYQAVAELCTRLGYHIGTMFNFQQTMQKNENYLYDMQVLQYDMLYGKRYVYGKTNPFSKSVLALGVKPVRVDRVQKVSANGVYYVYGENFTQSCKFQVNSELADTTFLDSGTLLVRNVTLQKGDWVNVAVQSNSSTHGILSTSNTLVYGVGRLADMGSDEKTGSVPESVMAQAESVLNDAAGHEQEPAFSEADRQIREKAS